MKPARIPYEIPVNFFLPWMLVNCLFLIVFAFFVSLLPDSVILVSTGILLFIFFTVCLIPVYIDRVVFPEGMQIRLFGKPIRKIPVSDFKILCAVGNEKLNYLCLSGWTVAELAQCRESILQKGLFTRQDLPFIKRNPDWTKRLAKEYLLKPNRIAHDPPILWLPFDPVLLTYMRRMYPQLPYVDLRSDKKGQGSLYPRDQIPLTGDRYRLDEAGIHILDKFGKNERRCFQPQQIKTIFRLDRFVSLSNFEPGYVKYLVVSELELGELAQRGKKKAGEKWKKQLIEQLPEAEAMYATEFYFSGFFVRNWRSATDCHLVHTPELEKQLRQLCPSARWVDYSDKWL